MRHTIALLALISVMAPVSRAQQDKTELPNPASSICEFKDGKIVKTGYYSSRVKSRKIFGGLVPYDKVWITGANEATTFVTDTDLSVGGKNVPAGSYTLFTIPAREKWTLIISKPGGEGDISYRKGGEVIRVDMKVSRTTSLVKNFTIAYKPKEETCTLTMSWENTQASVEVAEKKLCWPTTSPLTYECQDQ